ncbi:MAG: hypothetical protein AAB947_01955 [Patescibacteria group bacterium]
MEETPRDDAMQHVRRLARQGIIELKFENGKATSTVSVIQAIE